MNRYTFEATLSHVDLVNIFHILKKINIQLYCSFVIATLFNLCSNLFKPISVSSIQILNMKANNVFFKVIKQIKSN